MTLSKNNFARNGAIDVLRILMAFLVITNHSCIFGSMSQDYLDCAVPVFLIITGYYFPTKDLSAEIDKIKRTCRKLIGLILGAICLYLVWDLLKYIIWDETTPYSLSTLYTCRNLFCPPLWYVQALLYLMVLLLCIDKIIAYLHYEKYHISNLPIWILATVVIVVWSLFKFGVIQLIPNDNNLICLVFLFIGILIKRCPINIKNKWLIFIGGGIIIINTILKLNGLNIDAGVNSCYHYSTVILSVLIFLFFKNLNIKSTHFLARWGLNYSMHIYIVHWIFIEIWYKNREGLPHTFMFAIPFIIFTFCMLASFIYQYICKKQRILLKKLRG